MDTPCLGLALEQNYHAAYQPRWERVVVLAWARSTGCLRQRITHSGFQAFLEVWSLVEAYHLGREVLAVIQLEQQESEYLEQSSIIGLLVQATRCPNKRILP